MELDNIYFGDCINLMEDIPDKSIDLCVTDAPYLHNKSPLSPTYDGSEWNQTSSFGKSELYKYGGDCVWKRLLDEHEEEAVCDNS